MAIDLIKNKFYDLIAVIQSEVKYNNSAKEFLDYILNEKKRIDLFANVSDQEYLKDFVRGVNRYSDEFLFSDIHKDDIKKKISELYDLLNSKIEI